MTESARQSRCSGRPEAESRVAFAREVSKGGVKESVYNHKTGKHDEREHVWVERSKTGHQEKIAAQKKSISTVVVTNNATAEQEKKPWVTC